jgi:hypothetical protein
VTGADPGLDVQVLAHGLGGSSDLPIPFTYALLGGAWALTFTFAVVALAWKQPRFDPARQGKPLPRWVTTAVDAPAVRWTVALLALLLTAWVAVAAVFGPQTGENALPGVFYVLLWVGLVALSVLIGPVWRLLSPARTLYRLLPWSRRPPPLTYPERLGYWPAVFGLFAFVWLELASPNPGSLWAVKVWLLTYLVVTLAGAIAFGTTWPARADPFEVYGIFASRLAPLRRNDDGRVAIGNPFDHLPMFALIVAATFWLAARATGGVDRATRRALPGLMAHSLIPIVVGYIFAHYLTYLIERGQQTILRLADPFGTGWLGDVEVSYVLSMHPGVLATLKVAFVVLGHVAGVVAAHDRALRVLPKRHRLTGQLAMMLVMTGYTFMGLWLLFGG